jgi:hypothetical protein
MNNRIARNDLTGPQSHQDRLDCLALRWNQAALGRLLVARELRAMQGMVKLLKVCFESERRPDVQRLAR